MICRRVRINSPTPKTLCQHTLLQSQQTPPEQQERRRQYPGQNATHARRRQSIRL